MKSIHFVSLGCPKNRVDTEVMLGLVDRAGHRIVPEAEGADVIVVNTCGFIDEAKEESIDAILEMARHTETGSCSKLVVTGCLVQRHHAELSRDMPEVDHFLGSADFQHILSTLDGSAGREQVTETPKYIYDPDTAPRLAPERLGISHTAYLKIAEGCDRPCAFCIIPKLRGPQRSRSIESIEREAIGLVAAGAREINLIAQDLTTYGTDLPDTPTLAMLLRRLARVPGLRWLRLHYAYPTAVTDELIDVIASEPVVVKYLDMPLQHIDDKVLKTMRRGHTSKLTRSLIEKLRERIPGLTLRTTFIAGHPGEDDAAFDALCAFVREVEFDRVGCFRYSREEGTVAALLPHRVPEKTAEQRRIKLMRIQRDISKKKQKALVGQELEILVEGPSDESDYLLQGRHAGQAPEIDGTVYLTDGAARAGEMVRARVKKAADYDLAATILGAA